MWVSEVTVPVSPPGESVEPKADMMSSLDEYLYNCCEMMMMMIMIMIMMII
jgi:hypothetical protein